MIYTLLFNSTAYDIITLIGEIDLFVKNLHKWMQPEHTSVPAVMIPATAEVVHEPWGVALVIGAFNFPIVLLLSPLIGKLFVRKTNYKCTNCGCRHIRCNCGW